MIIWINGAFGSGKTQTAHELCRRMPQAFLYDPENVGYFLRKNTPKALEGDDFQDMAAWRECNYSILKMLHNEYKGPIIVPMTLVNAQYFDEIVGELRRDGAEVKHFALCASKDVILGRLKKRREVPHSWAAQQIDRCMAGLSQEVFQRHIDTDRLSIDQVVEHIAGLANVELLPDRRGRVQKAAGRIMTQLKHIRYF